MNVKATNTQDLIFSEKIVVSLIHRFLFPRNRNLGFKPEQNTKYGMCDAEQIEYKYVQ